MKQEHHQFLAVFSNIQKCRPEAADDVISGLAEVYFVLDIRVKFGDTLLNTSRIILLWPTGQVFRILPHAADRKHLVMLFPADLWGLLSHIIGCNFVILA